MSKAKILAGDKIKGGQAGGAEKRGGALDVKGFKNDMGNSFSFSTADSPKEDTLRGGANTSMSNPNPPVKGGEFSPEKARSGYPSNQGIKTDK